ncbi:hypothetical protein AMTR_s00063p00137260 [Amborella trichopoda]|uniref:Uncharacterized protein n=1 Tax=Amborella trichopoda TaxID=13333 RepID=U5D4A1_AMBTC|nr:hypothetical protein AMTR_s00063p00137260 [Amborella trichopoda]
MAEVYVPEPANNFLGLHSHTRISCRRRFSASARPSLPMSFLSIDLHDTAFSLERLKEANLLVDALHCKLQERSEQLATEKFIYSYQEAEVKGLTSKLCYGHSAGGNNVNHQRIHNSHCTCFSSHQAPEALKSSHVSVSVSNHAMTE